MKTTVYTVYAGESPEYFARKIDAIKSANEWADITEESIRDTITVEKCETDDLPLRELAAKLLSGEGWCANSVEVYSVKPRKKVE